MLDFLKPVFEWLAVACGRPDLARQEMEKLGSLAPATPGGALRPLTAR